VSARERFWAEVHALLDARRDPFDDPALTDALLDEPELCGAVVRLRERLARLGEARPTPVRRPLRRAAAAAILAVAVLSWALTRERSGAPRVGADPGSVVRFSITTTTVEGGHRRASTIAGGAGRPTLREGEVRPTGGRPPTDAALLAYHLTVRDP